MRVFSKKIKKETILKIIIVISSLLLIFSSILPLFLR
ncbi:MAG: hypothetical protein KatS3mg092_0846 [Patescibacteria group bacterium]|nr:MAG: hypothetical protein KatS3mg092_0846 [Patescibacteria group bacterium]